MTFDLVVTISMHFMRGAKQKEMFEISVLRRREILHLRSPGHVAQSVTCLATDASLTTDPGVTSLILALSLTLVEIDHEIISTVILLPCVESFKKGC